MKAAASVRERSRIGDSPVVDVVVGAFRATPRAASALAVGVVAAAALPIGLTLATGAVVGRVPAASRVGLGSAAGHRLGTAVTVFAALYVAQYAVGYLLAPMKVATGLRFALFVRESVMAATFGPVGTGHLEDRAIADELATIENAEVRQALSRSIVPALCDLASARLTGLAQAVVLFAFAWWAPLVVGLAAFATHRWLRREVSTFLRATELATTGLRRSGYYRELAVGTGAAKEVRVFGLAEWIFEHFAERWRGAMGEVWRERGSHRLLIVQVAAASTSAYGVVFYAIGHAALAGHIGLGRVAVFASAAVGMSNLAYAGDTETLIRQGAPILRRALRLKERLPVDRITSAPAVTTRRGSVSTSIRFEGVDFAYPGATSDVLSGLTLEIPTGQSLAVVGENGAGKTTLIKLLARLHEPTAGRIVVDGVALSEMPATEWRARLAVIFQDFVRYELSLRDNVGFGAPDLLADDAALADAMSLAGAGEVLEQVGWDTALSRAYEGGTDLSGGQWQKVALARAMAAVGGGASILVLDEPTANLDVRAEAELFDRFLTITRGLTTILISHRFSSVRRADRICVLAAGRVAEIGSHDELMALEGTYARMFTLQASRFRETPA